MLSCLPLRNRATFCVFRKRPSYTLSTAKSWLKSRTLRIIHIEINCFCIHASDSEFNIRSRVIMSQQITHFSLQLQQRRSLKNQSHRSQHQHQANGSIIQRITTLSYDKRSTMHTYNEYHNEYYINRYLASHGSFQTNT